MYKQFMIGIVGGRASGKSVLASKYAKELSKDNYMISNMLLKDINYARLTTEEIMMMHPAIENCVLILDEVMDAVPCSFMTGVHDGKELSNNVTFRIDKWLETMEQRNVIVYYVTQQLCRVSIFARARTHTVISVVRLTSSCFEAITTDYTNKDLIDITHREKLLYKDYTQFIVRDELYRFPFMEAHNE